MILNNNMMCCYQRSYTLGCGLAIQMPKLHSFPKGIEKN